MRSKDEPTLFNRRISTPLPGFPNGQDIAFRCFVDDGAIYYCKDDKNGRPIRATEWLATQLAFHLGISVADCAVIEDDDGNTYFGSRGPKSVADDIEVAAYLGAPVTGEFGQPLPWLGRYLAGLYAYDLFVDNPDRCQRNFILDRDGFAPKLCAIDFASARLIDFTIDRFPIESDNTVRVGGVVRRTHGPHVDAAMEMLDRIDAIRPNVIDGILGQMPEDWLTQGQRAGFKGVWSDGRHKERVARIRAVLKYERKI